jgi:cobalamin synthase
MKGAVRSLFHTFTGYGKRPEGGPEAGDALAAVFLPLMALAAGAAAALVVWLFRLCGLYLASMAAGIAALAALGGARRMKAVSSLFSEPMKAAGTVVAGVLVLLFQTFAIYESSMYRATADVYLAMLYLPVAGAAAMLAAASVMKEECAGTMFAAVKGGHMLLGCLLAFVLMLPAFGFKSLAFVAAPVLAGPAMALALRRRGGGETPYVAAVAGEILFLILLALLRGPVIYY